MRFITCADSHFSNSLSYNKVDPVTGISARFQEQLDLFKLIIDQAVERDVARHEYVGHERFSLLHLLNSTAIYMSRASPARSDLG